ncbi:MAG: undecaprenyl-diphosphate phosphatase [Deltaproteobacteria bacterium]|nr:undecaprenyl-diphosphate phosphatase [Deltaproteobacteria bacterium]
MPIHHAILLGLVEGLTELLPVSSTGHLILVNAVLRHESEAAKTLDVVIQLGAVLAIALYFRRHLMDHGRGLVARRTESVRLAAALLAAFLPAAVVGLLCRRWIKAHLFGPVPVAWALLVGGVAMLVVERWQRANPGESGIERIGWRKALWIGVCQCLALWPGASRSMTTIVGGQLGRLDTRTAAEFSFLLALPTLGAATVLDLYKGGRALLAIPGGGAALAIGTGVSFGVTWLVVALFLRHVSRVGMAPFAWYRLALAVVVFLCRDALRG